LRKYEPLLVTTMEDELSFEQRSCHMMCVAMGEWSMSIQQWEVFLTGFT
jgi:hypothetical protein